MMIDSTRVMSAWKGLEAAEERGRVGWLGRKSRCFEANLIVKTNDTVKRRRIRRKVWLLVEETGMAGVTWHP